MLVNRPSSIGIQKKHGACPACQSFETTDETDDAELHNQALGQVCGRLPEGSLKGETSGNERIK